MRLQPVEKTIAVFVTKVFDDAPFFAFPRNDLTSTSSSITDADDFAQQFGGTRIKPTSSGPDPTRCCDLFR
jgi:hypothetical protein